MTSTVTVWSVRCYCGAGLILGTDMEGGLIEWCSNGHMSHTTVQRA